MKQKQDLLSVKEKILYSKIKSDIVNLHKVKDKGIDVNIAGFMLTKRIIKKVREFYK